MTKSALLAGNTDHRITNGWLCLFEGTKQQCIDYYNSGLVSDDYDSVFIMSPTEGDVNLRSPKSKSSWVNKLSLEVIEDEETGGATIHIEWDESDPELEYWNDLGQDGQKAFILDCIHRSLERHGD